MFSLFGDVLDSTGRSWIRIAVAWLP